MWALSCWRMPQQGQLCLPQLRVSGLPALHRSLPSDPASAHVQILYAEQGNVWYGQFQAIVREMTRVHFNFFLDEMIYEKNEHTIAVLSRRGRHPRVIPVEELKLSRS